MTAAFSGAASQPGLHHGDQVEVAVRGDDRELSFRNVGDLRRYGQADNGRVAVAACVIHGANECATR